MNKLKSKLKNILIVEVVIILLLIGIGYSAQKLSNYITEYNNYGYTMSLTK